MTPPERDIACADLVEVLAGYLDGALDPVEVAMVERHLERCLGCVVFLEQLHTVIDILGTVAVPTVPDDVVERLLGLFRAMPARG